MRASSFLPVAARRLRRERVAELGVLLREQLGRRDEHEVTVVDSTGLAVQDVAAAVAVYEAYREEPAALPDVPAVQVG